MTATTKPYQGDNDKPFVTARAQHGLGVGGGGGPVPGNRVSCPDEIRVPCPMRRALLVTIEICNGCPHYHGLTPARFPGGPFSFREQHMVVCAYPRSLALFEQAPAVSEVASDHEAGG